MQSCQGLVTVGADEDAIFSLNESVNGAVTLSDGVTQVTSQGENVIYSLNGDVIEGVSEVDGRVVFTLTHNENGTPEDPTDDEFTFELVDQLDHATPGSTDDSQTLNLNLSPAIVATDSDLDPVSLDKALQIKVEDDVPVLSEETHSETVHEDALDNSQSTGNAEGGQTTTAVITYAELSGLVTVGADEDAIFSLNESVNGAVTLSDGVTQVTSQGENVIYSLNGDVIEGVSEVDGRVVFTLTHNENGTPEDPTDDEFTFELVDQLDHATPGSTDDSQTLNLNLSPAIVATDSDLDPVSLDKALQIKVEDDVPVLSEETHSETVHEDALDNSQSTGNAEGGQTTTAVITYAELSGLVTVGADEDAIFSLNESVNGAVTLSDGVTQVTSQGENVIYSLNGDVIEGVSEVDGRVVFTLTHNENGTPEDPTDDEFTFELVDQLDHATPGSTDDSQTLNLNLSPAIVATDSDLDPVSLDKALQIKVEDDVPVLSEETHSETVHEDALDNSQSTGNAEGGQTTTAVITYAELSGLVTVGADEDAIFSLNESVNGAVTLSDGVTQVTSQGENVIYSLNGDVIEGVSEVDGRVVFTLTHNENGTPEDPTDDEFTFELVDQLDHATPGSTDDSQTLNLNLSPAIVATDSDLDPVSLDKALQIKVEDDVPVLKSQIQMVVDEDALTGGIEDGVGDVDYGQGTENTTETRTLSFNAGADEPLSLSFADLDGYRVKAVDEGNNSVDMTSGGVNVVYSWDADGGLYNKGILTGWADFNGDDEFDSGEEVFTLEVLQSDPSSIGYKFTLLAPVDHPDDSKEDDLIVSIPYTLMDSDGDEISSTDPGYGLEYDIKVLIDDDSPVVFTPTSSTLSAPEDSVATVTGSLNFEIHDGADQPADVVFKITEGDPATTTSGNQLYLDGEALFLYYDDSSGSDDLSVIVAKTVDGDVGFEISIDVAADMYTVTTHDLIYESISVDSGDLTDITGGTTTLLPFINIGSTELDILISGSASVNTSADDMGIGNQHIEARESLRYDFVNELTSTPTYTDHYDVFRFIQSVYSVNGSPTANPFKTANLTITALLADEDNVFYGDTSGESKLALDQENIIVYDGSGSEIPYDTHGLAVIDNGDTITLTGMQAGWQFVVVSDLPFTALQVDGAAGTTKFSLSQFTFQTESVSEDPLELSFAITGSDYDGDSVDSTISVTLQPDPNEAPEAIDDSATTDEETSVAIDLLANDTDADGSLDLASVVVLSDPSHGSVVVNATTGKATYTPDTNFYGQDTFTYKVYDDDGKISNEATVTITVDNDEEPPSLTGDTQTVYEKALADGSYPELDSETTTGSFTVVANDGIAIITIAGQAIAIADLLNGSYPDPINAGNGTLTVTGYSGDEYSGTVSYSYTLTDNVEHAKPANDTVVDDDITISVQDAQGEDANGALTMQIVDDVPSAIPVTESATATPIDTNIMLIMDTSGSMEYESGITGYTRMEATVKAAQDLIDKYEALGDVRVTIVEFNWDATKWTNGWVDSTVADDSLEALLNQVDGATNFDAALLTAMDAWDDAGKLPDAQNVSYFLSDGDPTANSRWFSGWAKDDGITDNDPKSEQEYWEQWLTGNQITSYAFGLGQYVEESELDPIAYDGDQPPYDASLDEGRQIEFADLDSVLSATIPQDALTGSLSLSLGADQGGHVTSVTIEGATYTYDANNPVVTVDTDEGGRIQVDMDTGDYEYTVPAQFDDTFEELIGFALVDGDGDTSSSSLLITNYPLPDPINESWTGDDNDNIQSYASLVDGENAYLDGQGGDDSLTGSSGTDILKGGDGDDALDGGAGADVVIGGHGADTLVYDQDDTVIDGGNGGGNDALVFNTGESIDFASVTDNPVKNMEEIDLRENGDHTLSNLAPQDVLDMTDGDNELYVLGDSGDNVSLTGGWGASPTVGAEYTIYTDGTAILHIDNDIHTTTV